MEPYDRRDGGLDGLAALGMLAEHGLTHVAPHVAELLVCSLDGDPDAVLETARLLTDDQRAGAALLPDPLPAVPSLHRAVAPVLRGLPDDARRLLLVAAVSVVDRTDVLLRAAGTDLDALLAGPAVGCLDLVAGHVRIRDPRIRAVVHHDATVAERTAAHRSLAAAHAAEGNDDVATWHRALACLEGDPEVAPRLVAVAERMLARGEAVWAQRVAREATSHAEGAVRAVAVAVAGRAALHAGHVAEAVDLLREALRTCEPEAADALRTALLVAVSHLTGQVPRELVDRDGSPWARLVAAVLQAARDTTASASSGAEVPSTVPGLSPDLLALARATVGLLAGEVPPVPPQPADGDPVRGAMVGVLRAVALAADGQVDAARCAVVSVVAALGPLPGDRAWAPQTSPSGAAEDRACAMTPLVEAHVRLVEGFVEMWAGNLEGALAAVTRAALRLPLGLCVHGAAAVVAGRASVLAHGERGVLAEALDRLVPLPQSPAVRTGLLTDRALALLLQGEAPGAVTLLGLCEERSCPGELPLPTLRSAEARLVAGAASSSAAPAGRGGPEPAGASSSRGGVPEPAGVWSPRGGAGRPAAGSLAEALMPTARARLAVAERGLAGGLREGSNPGGSTGSLVEQGLTRLVVGQALVGADRAEEGREHLRAAARLLDDAGAGAVARLAGRLLEQTQNPASGLRVAGALTPHPPRRARALPVAAWVDALTEREVQVALVIADGASNRLAARHLGLSERTVEVHLTSIFRKVGVGSRTELALLVSRSEHVV